MIHRPKLQVARFAYGSTHGEVLPPDIASLTIDRDERIA
jgi:hypothetical protein